MAEQSPPTPAAALGGFRAMQNSIKSLCHMQSSDFYILHQCLSVNLVLVEDARDAEGLSKPERGLGPAKGTQASRNAAKLSF